METYNKEIINPQNFDKDELIDDENDDIIDSENKTYIDEELEDIEYYEILSFDEIIKENNKFIAFTKKELYNEIYELFNNANKTNSFINLFYNIVDDKEFDTTNYILTTDCVKKIYYENDDNLIEDENGLSIPENGLIEFIKNFRKINNFKDLNLAKKEKNKLFFSIMYDDKSNLVRFKPLFNTNIKIKPIKFDKEGNQIDDYVNKFDEYYLLLNTDDTNVPVKQINYKIPTYINKDNLSDKVLSYLKKPKEINLIDTISNLNINDNLKLSKPTIDNIIDNIDFDELNNLENIDIDYISKLLEKFDYCFDNINKEDYDKLYEKISKIFENTKIEKVNFKSFRIKLINLINYKTLFYEKISNIFKLLKFSDDIINEHDSLISKLEDEKNNIDDPDLLYNNIYDVASAIHNNDIDENIIINNIKNIMNNKILENLIITIKNYNTNDIDKIEELYNIEKNKFDLMKKFSYSLYQKSFKFVNFSNEIYDIILANDINDYYITTLNENPSNNFLVDADNKDDLYEIDNLDFNYALYNLNTYDIYIQNPLFQNADGFKEVLNIILPLITKIQEKSKLDIDYNILCSQLYKNFSGLSTKKYNLINKIDNISDYSDEIINNILNINYYIIIKNKKNIDDIKSKISLYTNKNIDKLIEIIIDINTEFFNNIKDMFYHSISIWILEIQKNIIDGLHIHNYNYNYINLWDDYGFPINKTKKNGITFYLSEIIIDLFVDDDNLDIFNIDNKLVVTITNLIENSYKDILDDLKNKSSNIKINNNNKGKKFQLNLVDNLNEFKKNKTNNLKDKMLDNYVNALIYMPGINYNRIHKYLLGCCLQQLNNDFLPDSDLKGKRNDLLAAKNYFAKNKYNNKSRPFSYLPYDSILKDDIDADIDVDIDKIFIDNNFENLNHNIFNIYDKYNYDIWFNNIKKNEMSYVFNNDNYTNIYNNGSNEYIKIIKNYLNYLSKTINIKKSYLINNYIDNIDNINFKQLIYNAKNIIYNELLNSEEYDNILDYSLKLINNLLIEFNNLNNITDNDLNNINRAKAYITIKCICCPFNTDNIINEKMELLIDNEFDNNIKYINILKNIHNSSSKILNISNIPTLKENIEFLGKMREEFKNKKLELFDKQTEEQRKVFNELSKIGIRVENIIDNNFDNDINNDLLDNNNNINPEIPVFNGENEFNMFGNNDDNHHDDLDNENHGFIYNQY